MFISLGITIVLYVFIAGTLAGMIIVDNKEEIKLASRTERMFMVLLILFWPISILIGAGLKLLEKTDSV